MTIALSAVLAAQPTQGIFPGNYSIDHQSLYPWTQTYPIQDSTGTPIDASAGTVVSELIVAALGTTPFGEQSIEQFNFTTPPTVDLSVPGFATITLPYQLLSYALVARAWKMRLQAIDTSGGTAQDLLNLSWNITANP